MKNIQVITLHPNQLVMDQEQVMIDSQYAGFQVNEVMQQPQPQPQPQPLIVQQQLPLPAPQVVSPQEQASSPQVVGDISMNIEQKPQEVNTEGYSIVDDAGGEATTNPFKTVAEAENDSEATYANTGERFGNSPDDETHEVEGENLDMGITMENNEDTDLEDKLGMDFDFESLFGRNR